MKKYLLPLLLVLTSCSYFISKIDQEAVNAKSMKKSNNPQNLAIVFSHNISGETHPCGCRNFPLGGLPQVAGLFANLSKTSEVFYVDTGDTFFPSSVIPTSMKDSLSFAANNLALGLDQLGLKYFVPGDQDFALGLDFLKNLANTRNFEFLISNLADESIIKHKRFAIIERNHSKIFLIGFVAPDVFNDKTSELFTDIPATLPKVIEEIKAQGYQATNPNHRLVVLSHAGFDPDDALAIKFPFIDWIIGAHSQSFLRFSRDEGNVKIVQTLSKNHYVGNINIDTNAQKASDTYVLHEIRDELEKNLSPNPFRHFVDDHKARMNEIQLQEQSHMGMDNSPTAQLKRFKTASSCIECHKVQGEFWQGTPHSIAYTTLMNTHEQNNLQCIKCHSLGLGDPKGFTAAKNMVSFKDRPIIDYWNKVHAMSSEVASVRKLESKEIRAISKKWFEFDKKSGVKNNFANVQCLNCHNTHDEHPFNPDMPITAETKTAQIKNKCLACHTADQSPEWYGKDSKTINEKFVAVKFKKMSCPLSSQ
ncbi:MAG: multiheme c-type cytochrome [Bacteriovorax sp.]|nr:multiheme c-type cytochrome [Bacteriovorax sp.]